MDLDQEEDWTTDLITDTGINSNPSSIWMRMKKMDGEINPLEEKVFLPKPRSQEFSEKVSNLSVFRSKVKN